MKLEVGLRAYSKTCRDYGIGKRVNITENGQGFKGDLIDTQYKYSKHAIENQDVFASHNIIDLIEEGDYVNGYKVTAIYNPNGDDIFNFTLIMEHGYKTINPYIRHYPIKSIVTKEQFDSMKYGVGDR